MFLLLCSLEVVRPLEQVLGAAQRMFSLPL